MEKLCLFKWIINCVIIIVSDSFMIPDESYEGK